MFYSHGILVKDGKRKQEFPFPDADIYGYQLSTVYGRGVHLLDDDGGFSQHSIGEVSVLVTEISASCQLRRSSTL